MSYSLTTEFPFNFLHSEVVKYYIEKHAEYKQKRQEFLEKTRHNEDSSIVEKDKNLLAQLAMSVSQSLIFVTCTQSRAAFGMYFSSCLLYTKFPP